MKTCKSYKHADQEIKESILLIQTRWLKIQRQLELLRNIWSSLDEEYQIHQNSVLQVLHGKAQAAITLIDNLIGKPNDEATVRSIMSKKGEARRLKYALSVKSCLNSILIDLKEWSEVFDVSWYLIVRLSSKELDQELGSIHTGVPALSTMKDLRVAINSKVNDQAINRSTILLPTSFFGDERRILSQGSSELWKGLEDNIEYLIDYPSSVSPLPDICKLAKILRKIEPFDFGILSCRGLMEGEAGNRLVFAVPSTLTDPQYLRTLVLSPAESYSLDDRFSLAKQLGKAVMFVHSAGFVHKNIRPETILVLRDQDTRSLWAFLTGFENFRLAEGKTQLQGDDEWEKNLYRHPTRQGIQPEEDYSMQHDIYSLGVCLLEIGVGRSLVWSSPGETTLKPILELSVTADASIRDRRKKAFETKRMLVRMSQEQLPPKMGHKYADTVVTCLTCLDKTYNSFGDTKEFCDENGILVGVRFIEKVSVLRTKFPSFKG